MGVAVSQNGILSHEGLRSEEGAQDRRSDEHHCADSTQAERKIFNSFAVSYFPPGAMRCREALCGPLATQIRKLLKNREREGRRRAL